MSIKDDAKYLTLSYTFHHYEQLIAEAEETGMTIREFLEDMLSKEAEQRKANGIQRRLRQAHFPYRKYLTDFKSEHFSKDLRLKIRSLQSLRFLEHGENIILIGNPGTGKTHLAIALGIEACMKEKNVLFSSVPNLMIELKEAMSLHQVNAYRKKFERYDLVILDELGYISFDKEGSEILFNLLSNRNDRGSIIITSNLVFERWDEIFKDPILTGAIVDRLAHKAHVLDMSGDSYRIKETLDWLK